MYIHSISICVLNVPKYLLASPPSARTSICAINVFFRPKTGGFWGEGKPKSPPPPSQQGLGGGGGELRQKSEVWGGGGKVGQRTHFVPDLGRFLL